MRIGILAKLAACDVETVRYYEREGLLEKPERAASGYRHYAPRHLEALQFIRHCRSLDMKLAEIRQLLDFRRLPERDCSGINALLDAQIARVLQQIQMLESLKEQLYLLRAECEQRQSAQGCGILRSLNDAAMGRPCPCHEP
ncbi:MAG: MerR family transcriptional regulator [Magnetococcales bacterium]|nr:MerR family transcriptional regulator [Magnetococcales bacterium]NGZ06773.1 MerR family transcriptional regulator [Magnetococcales bacterium]